MNALKANYFEAYRSLKLTRDAAGVPVAEFHSNGGSFTFMAQDHTELVDAFYRIAQDRANKIVILTGAGGDFIPGIDFSSFGNVADPGVWSQRAHCVRLGSCRRGCVERQGAQPCPRIGRALLESPGSDSS